MEQNLKINPTMGLPVLLNSSELSLILPKNEHMYKKEKKTNHQKFVILLDAVSSFLHAVKLQIT
jgi:hypothetical protein